jgi:hypothetical protein
MADAHCVVGPCFLDHSTSIGLPELREEGPQPSGKATISQTLALEAPRRPKLQQYQLHLYLITLQWASLLPLDGQVTRDALRQVQSCSVPRHRHNQTHHQNSAPRPTAQRNITTYRTVMIFEQYGDELRIAGVSIDV